MAVVGAGVGDMDPLGQEVVLAAVLEDDLVKDAASHYQFANLEVILFPYFLAS